MNQNLEIIDLSLPSELQKNLGELGFKVIEEGKAFYAPSQNMDLNLLSPEVKKIQQEGLKFQESGYVIYWLEGTGFVVSEGKAGFSFKEQILTVLKQVWCLSVVCKLVEQELNTIREQTLLLLPFEQKIGPSSLKHLKKISAELLRLRRLDLLINSPLVDGSGLSAKGGASLRLLFNSIADEKLELLDYHEIVWEKVEQLLEYYEEWQEKLIEYSSFFNEAILEVIIIVVVLAGVIHQVIEGL